MGIHVFRQPNQVVTAENNIIIEAYEDDIVDVAGSEQTARLLIDSYHNNGDGFQLTIVGIGPSPIIFNATCRTTVIDPTKEYPVRTTETFKEWAEKIKAMFFLNAWAVNNFKISTYFVSSRNQYYITFEPYVKDGSVSMTMTYSNISITFRNSLYSENDYHDNLNIALNLFVETANYSQTWLEKVIDSPSVLPPTIKNNRAYGKWDLKTMVKNEYFGHFNFPLDLDRYTRYIVDVYKANIFSLWGDPQADQNNAFSNEFVVLDSNLSKQKMIELNTDGKSILTYLQETKMFLSNAPIEKTTDIYAPEKLYFFFLQSYTNAVLRVKEYYSNGTNNIRTVTTISPNENEIIEFNCGFQTIKLDDYTTPGLTPIKWDIWLETSVGDFISEIRTYIIDTTHQQNSRYWIFKNRWGVYECLRTTGKGEKTLPWSKTLFKRNVELPERTDREIMQIDENVFLTIKCNSGFITKEWNMFLTDEFFASRDVYWLKGDKAYAVYIEASTPMAGEDDEYLPTFDFTAIGSDISDSMFTDFGIPQLPVLGDFNGDFNNDYLI